MKQRSKRDGQRLIVIAGVFVFNAILAFTIFALLVLSFSTFAGWDSLSAVVLSFLFGIGGFPIWQLFYIVPAVLFLRRKGRVDLANCMLTAAFITFAFISLSAIAAYAT